MVTNGVCSCFYILSKIPLKVACSEEKPTKTKESKGDFLTVLSYNYNLSTILYFHPYLGKWSNLTNIFQMGWNHQPVTHVPKNVTKMHHWSHLIYIQHHGRHRSEASPEVGAFCQLSTGRRAQETPRNTTFGEDQRPWRSWHRDVELGIVVHPRIDWKISSLGKWVFSDYCLRCLII